MTVYVDTGKAPYRRMLMCHMIADTNIELLQMADTIGVARKWIQYPGTYREHFDICQSKCKLALAAGAEQLSPKELVLKIQQRKAGARRN